MENVLIFFSDNVKLEVKVNIHELENKPARFISATDNQNETIYINADSILYFKKI